MLLTRSASVGQFAFAWCAVGSIEVSISGTCVDSIALNSKLLTLYVRGLMALPRELTASFKTRHLSLGFKSYPFTPHQNNTFGDPRG